MAAVVILECKIMFSVHGFVENLNFLAIWPRFGPFWLLLMHMRRNGPKTTSGIKFDSIFKLYMPDFLYDEKFWKLDHDFRYFLLCMRTNGRELLRSDF